MQGKNIEASTSSILQGIENAKAQKNLLEANTKLQELSVYKESQTMNDVINGIRNQVEIQAETLESLKMQNEITQATLQDKIQQIKSEAIQVFLINKLTEVNTDKARADINLTNQKIWEISQTIAQKTYKIAMGMVIVSMASRKNFGLAENWYATNAITNAQKPNHIAVKIGFAA